MNIADSISDDQQRPLNPRDSTPMGIGGHSIQSILHSTGAILRPTQNQRGSIPTIESSIPTIQVYPDDSTFYENHSRFYLDDSTFYENDSLFYPDDSIFHEKDCPLYPDDSIQSGVKINPTSILALGIWVKGTYLELIPFAKLSSIEIYRIMPGG